MAHTKAQKKGIISSLLIATQSVVLLHYKLMHLTALSYNKLSAKAGLFPPEMGCVQ